MTRGDICLVSFPFTDGSAAKVRPVLIISADRFNRGGDVVVLPISSSPEPGDEFSVYIPDPDFKAAGLRFPSAIKWNKPATIAKSVVRRRLGALQDNYLSQTTEKLKTVFDS